MVSTVACWAGRDVSVAQAGRQTRTSHPEVVVLRFFPVVPQLIHPGLIALFLLDASVLGRI